jgi:non-ribosomal peptide synthetase component F/thioester reductase-like protein/acyl carrier protein
MRCPGDEKIRLFVWQNLLDEDFEIEIGEHIDSCQKCLEVARRENQIKEFLDSFTIKSLGHLYVSTKIYYMVRILLKSLDSLMEDQRNSTFKQRLKQWREINEIQWRNTVIHVEIHDDRSIPIMGSLTSGKTSFLKRLSYITPGAQGDSKDIVEKKEIDIRVESSEKSIYIQFDSDTKYLPLIILISENSKLMFGKPGKFNEEQSHNLTFTDLNPGKYLLLIEPGEVLGKNITPDTSTDDLEFIPLPWTVDDYKRFADNIENHLNTEIIRIKPGGNTPLPASCKNFNPTLFYSINGSKKNYPRLKPPEKKQYDELLYTQKMLYFLQHLDENGTDYNIQGVFAINGNIATRILEDAFGQIIERYEILRTGFEIEKGKVIQRIHDSSPFSVEYLDYCQKRNISGETENSEAASELCVLDFGTSCTAAHLEPIVRDFIRPFDLTKPPLLRVGITKMEKENHLLIIDLHSIISDKTSLGILIEDFIDIISKENYPSCKFQYRDYIKWKRDQRTKIAFKKAENYWKQLYDNKFPCVNIPFDYPKRFMQRSQSERVKFSMSDKEKKELKELTFKEDITLKDLIFTIYNLMIWKLSEKDDTAVMIPISDSRSNDFKKVIGNFDHTLVVPYHPTLEKSFLQFILDVKAGLEEAIINKDYTFEDFIGNSNWRKSSMNASWFIPMFEWHEFELRNSQHPFLTMRVFEKQGIEKSDLKLKVKKLSEDFFFVFEYNEKLFKRRTIERFTSCFKEIVANISMQPEMKLSDIEIISREEKEKVLHEFNQNESKHPPGKTLQQLFEEVVSQIPGSIAVEGEFLRYDSKIFNTSQNVVQLSYQEVNNRSNQLARILRDKGVTSKSIVAIHEKNSIERLIGKLGILKSGGAYLSIAPSDQVEKTSRILKNIRVKIILSETVITDEEQRNRETISLSDLHSFTGEDSNLDNINREDDPAYIICSPCLRTKNRYVIFEHRNVTESWRLRDFAESKSKTSIVYVRDTESSFTNSDTWFRLITKHRLKLVDKGIPIKSVYSMELSTKSKSIISSYHLTLYENDFLQGINVGTILEGIFRGIKNSKSSCETGIFILGRIEKLKPDGIWGELCISGDMVPRGYLNDPESTMEKFSNNPFRKDERLYKSGEIARWLPDGRIELFDKIDILPKICGSMIEPGVLEEKDYIVYKRGGVGHIMQVKGALKRDAQPLIKKNRHTPPRNSIEIAVAKIWEKVLHANRVGIYDNFYEIGGDSLKAIKVMFLLEKEFEISLEKVLTHQNIAELSEQLVWKKEKIEQEIRKIREKIHIYSPTPLNSKVSTECDVYKHKLNREVPAELAGKRNYEHPLIVVGDNLIASSIFNKLIECIDSKFLLVVPGFFDIECKEQQTLHRKINCYFSDFNKTIKQLNILKVDFEEDYWGLSNSLYDRLSKITDAVVVICGDNCFNTFKKAKKFYKNNAAVTKQLLEFSCQEKKKDFHFISAINVGQVFYNSSLKGLSGVEKVIRQFRGNGINTCIYRLFNIVLNPATETRKNLEQSFFYNRLRTFIALGYAPEEKFGMTFVDDASKAISLLLTCKALKNETFYIMNPNTFRWDEIGNLLGSMGKKIKVVKPEQFIDQLLNKVYEKNLRQEVQKFLLSLHPKEDMGNARNWSVILDKTQHILEQLSFQWSKMSETDIEKIIENRRNRGQKK